MRSGLHGPYQGVKKLELFNNQNDRIGPGCNISCPLYRTLISIQFTSYTTQREFFGYMSKVWKFKII